MWLWWVGGWVKLRKDWGGYVWWVVMWEEEGDGWWFVVGGVNVIVCVNVGGWLIWGGVVWWDLMGWI